MILRGEFCPGAKLRQKELSERFGVAQGVVREALLELRLLGLVESIDRRGVYVARFDKERLLEALEVREAHEALAVRRCCHRVTRAEIRELIALAEKICELGSASKHRAEAQLLDRELHARLVHFAGNSMLVRLADNYGMLSTFVADERAAEVVRDEHIAILRAIEDDRAGDADRLMRQHIAACRGAIDRMFRAAGRG